jgi:RNA polymerase sigma-70 factor, ECF subfamily
LKSAPTTTTVLLESLKDRGHAAAWSEFDARFRPLLTAFAVRLGLGRDDAQEVAQETLVEFVLAYQRGQYDRTKGRLSSWILAIAKHRISRKRRADGRDADRLSDSSWRKLSEPARISAVWENEQRRFIIARAMEMLREGRMSEQSLRAFDLFVVAGVSAEETARECGMSVQDVYTAKYRVAKRLRHLVDELTAAWQESA